MHDPSSQKIFIATIPHLHNSKKRVAQGFFIPVTTRFFELKAMRTLAPQCRLLYSFEQRQQCLRFVPLSKLFY
jgi:hypothetical protein